MLTSEPGLVAGAAELLECALRYNSDMLPRLYLTGAFFFALAYCGSNLSEIARLFRVNHPPGRVQYPMTNSNVKSVSSTTFGEHINRPPIFFGTLILDPN